MICVRAFHYPHGGYVYPTIAVFIQWMPKGFSGQTYRSTDGAVVNVVEGSGRVPHR
jgi:gentisate 1,2-dioxygenase